MAADDFNIFSALECEKTSGGSDDNGAFEASSAAVVAPAPPASNHWALAGLTTNTGECAKNSPTGVCSSKPVASAIASFVAAGGGGAGPRGAPEAVKAAAKALNCGTEACVVSNPTFRRFAETKLGIPEAALNAELQFSFKPAGPRDTTELLSNTHIDETLRRWAESFPELFTYDFSMMDFDRTKNHFATIDIVDALEGRETQILRGRPARRPTACAACVLNTDVTGGTGKHWVAVFVDARGRGAKPWSVEYFNSTGRPPPTPVVVWMEKTRSRLAQHRAANPKLGGGPVTSVAVTSVAHQNGKTECGLYSLFYIRRRLEGTPYSFFEGDVIPDDAMTAFRRHVFRA